ncbi:MAG: dephospho-CoA kinase [Bacteroidales bacterium]|nr:dephospho-CoA kinase [Bacteroidales bacterium]
MIPTLIAITGGIGSGKSVVSQLLRTMGFTVYDCDERAKWVMTHDEQLRNELCTLFGPDTYLPSSNGTWELNKHYLSDIIFSSTDALTKMNACVHPAVWRDMQHQLRAETRERFFFESAILFESGFDQLSHPDEVWTVSAPLELRLRRAMRRDNAPREKVLSRIASQLPQEEKERLADHTIVNDDVHSLIVQVHELL